MQNNSSIHGSPLLHIDDSASDRLLIREAIARAHIPFLLHQADCLDSALKYFRHQRAAHPELHPFPVLVLLDYDLGGGHTGCEFLDWFRLTKKDLTTPVAVLSGSSGQNHVTACYSAGANYFIAKPSTMARFQAIASTLYLSLKLPDLPRRLPEYVPNPHHQTPVVHGRGPFRSLQRKGFQSKTKN